MKTGSFQKLVEQRLTREEIAEIRRQAHLEAEILRFIQKSISKALVDYMNEYNIGFNELVKKLDSSPSHVAKIQKGEANLTVSSLAHLLAAIGKEPTEIFKKK